MTPSVPIRLRLFIFAVCGFALSSYCQIPKSGNISTDETWAGIIHVTDDVTIATGVTVTVSPGTIVKVEHLKKITVDGTFNASGTELAKITFTALSDDTAGGDTNLDGNDTSATDRPWNQIHQRSTGSLTLTHVDMRYCNGDAVTVSGADFAANNLTITDALNDGIRFAPGASGTATLTNVTLTDIGNSTSDYGIWVDESNVVVNATNLTIHNASGQHIRADNANNWFSTGTTLTGTGIRTIEFQAGRITSDRSLEAGVAYRLTGTIYVDDDVTLTIPAGGIFKSTGSGELEVEGHLIAEGTAGNPIIFTSLLDDTRGGDLNGDLAATSPDDSDWVGFTITSTGTATISHAQIAYAQYPMRISGAISDLTDVSISDGAFVGIQYSGNTTGAHTLTTVQVVRIGSNSTRFGVFVDNSNAAVTVDDLTVQDVFGIHVKVDVPGNWQASNVTLSGTGQPVVNFTGGSIATDQTWQNDVVYLLTGKVTVDNGATLTLSSGQIVKANAAGSLAIDGNLACNGTVGAPVVFTSDHDDSVAGDTNDDDAATTPAAGDWDGIDVLTDGTADFTHVEVNYGGDGFPAIRMRGTSLTASNLDIYDSERTALEIGGSAAAPIDLQSVTIVRAGSNSFHVGLDVDNDNAIVTTDGLHVVDAGGPHVVVDNADSWTATNTTLSGSGLRAIQFAGGTIETDRSWEAGVPYHLTAAVTIAADASLTIPPGSILKGSGSGGFIVNGIFNARGTAGSGIIFTSIFDDSLGGEVNGDGDATSPAPGDCGEIRIDNDGVAFIDYLTFHYGGSGFSSYSIRTRQDAVLNLTNSTVAFGDGVFLDDGRATIQNCTFSDVSGFGVDVDVGADQVILMNCTFERTSDAAYNFNGDVPFTARNNTFIDCARDNAVVLDTSTISTNQRWEDAAVYFLDDGALVNQGISLQIAPGTIIKLDENTRLTADGDLIANATGAANRVVFTSIYDDSVGGDTNNDGTATSPDQERHWDGIFINETVSPKPDINLDWAEVRYAGDGTFSAVDVGGCNSFSMNNGRILDSAYNGLRIAAGVEAFTAENLTILNSDRNGVEIDVINPEPILNLANLTVDGAGLSGTLNHDKTAGVNFESRAAFDLSGLTVSNSPKANALFVEAGEHMIGSHNWPDGYVYYIEPGQSLRVGQQGTLAIGPGAILKFGQYNGIQVDGSLNAVGTAENPIILTSHQDDPNGGDSNEDGTSTLPNPGDWFSLWIRDTFGQINNIARVTLEHVQILNAGGENSTTSTPAILVDGGTHTLRDVLIKDVLDVGFRSRSSKETVCTITNMTIDNTVADAISIGTNFENGADTNASSGGGMINFTNLTMRNIGGDAIIYCPTGAAYNIDGLTVESVNGLHGTRILDSTAGLPLPATIGYLGLVVMNRFDVAATGSLTILPGTVVKFRQRTFQQGRSSLSARFGPIIANGTPEAPIIFTSEFDDTAGGVLDGNTTDPAPGDWQGIRLTPGSSIRHAEIRYGLADSTYAPLTLSEGDSLVENVIIRDVEHSAIFLYNGVHTIRNCLIYGLTENFSATTAIRYRPSSQVDIPSGFQLINNTIVGGRTSISIESEPDVTSSIINNSITGATEQGIFWSGFTPVTITYRNNNLYAPDAINGPVYDFESNTLTLAPDTGNLAVDPMFEDTTTFELPAGSPLIDAGHGSVAADIDGRGFPRFDDPAVDNLGTGSPAFVDIGARERLGSSDPSLNPDLVVEADSISATAAAGFLAGAEFTVTWTTTNKGQTAAPIHGTDAVFLSADAEWDVNDVLVGTYDKPVAGLDPGADYQGSLTAKLPNIADGTYYLIVRTDYNNDTFEFIESNNDATGTTSITVAVPELDLDNPTIDALTTGDNVRLYKVVIEEGQALDLLLTGTGQAGAMELLLGRDRVPTSEDNDQRSYGAPAATGTEIQFSFNEPGTFYVLVTLNNPEPGFNGPNNLTLTPSVLPFGITGVTPNQVGNGGNGTILVRGAQFTNATQIRLVSPSTVTLMPTAALLTTSGRFAATFDFTDVETGDYDLVVINPDDTATQLDAVTVVPGSPYDVYARPEVLVVAWETLRFQPPGPIPVSVIVENPTDRDLPILLAFNGQTNDSRAISEFSLPEDPLPPRAQLLIQPISNTGMPGILAPGERQVFTIYYHGVVTEGIPGLIADRLYMLAGFIPQDDTPIDYGIPGDPSFTQTEAVRRMGETWAEAGTNLRAEARRLLALGHVEIDTERLWRSTLERVSGTGTNAIAGTLVDATTGDPLPNETVIAGSADGSGFNFETTSDDNGAFLFENLPNDRYQVTSPDFFFENPPEVDVVFDDVVNGLIVAAAATNDTESPIESRLLDPSYFLVEGIPHRVFILDNLIQHSYLDNGAWTDPVAIPGSAGKSVSALYSATMLDDTPGIAVFFQQSGNDSPVTGAAVADVAVAANDVRIMHAVARPVGGDNWQWSFPTTYATSTNAAFVSPTATLTTSGDPLVVFQAVDFTDPEDDFDLYYGDRPLAAGDFVFPQASRSVPILSLDQPLSLSDDVTLPAGTVVTLGEDGRISGVLADDAGALAAVASREEDCPNFTITTQIQHSVEYDRRLPDWVPLLGGQNKFEATGALAITANLAGAAGQGSISVKVELFKEGAADPRVEATATFLGELKAELDPETCEHKLTELKLAGSIAIIGRFPIPQLTGNYGVLEYEVGCILGVNPLGGELVWKKGEGNIPSGKLVGGATVGFYGSIKLLELAEGSITGTGNMVLKVDGNGPGIDDVFFQVEGEAKVGWYVRKFTYRYPPSSTFNKPAASRADGEIVTIDPIVTPDGLVLEQTVELREKSGKPYDFSSAQVKPVLANVAADLVDDTGPTVTIGPDGKPMLFWTREAMSFSDPVGNRIQVATFDGTSWAAPTEIPGIDGFNRSLAPTIDENGNLLLVFAHADATGIDHLNPLAYLNAFEETDAWFVQHLNGSWTTPTPIALQSGMAGLVRTTLLPTSNAVWAAWAEGPPTSRTIFASRFNAATGVWSVAQTVGSGWIQSPPILSEQNGSPAISFSVGVDDPADGGQSPEIQEQTVLATSTFDGSSWGSAARSVGGSAARSAAREIQLRNPLISLTGLAPPAVCCDEIDESELPPPPQPPPMEDPRDPGPAAGQSPARLLAASQSGLVGAVDPNDKLGPTGFSDAGFIRPNTTLPYVIQFENDPDEGASAPALRVTITDVLPAEVDLDSFLFTQYGWGDLTRPVNPPVPAFNHAVDTTNADGSPLRVVVSGSLDASTRTVSVVFQSIDPATGLSPLGTFDGFLQVEEGGGTGQGYINFTIDQLADHPTGTEIENQASIVFDTNEAIDTPVKLNTIDADAPSSSVSALPTDTFITDFPVSWTGDDGAAGSGIGYYEIYVAVDAGNFALWLTTNATSATYPGTVGESYQFYSIAVDNVGYRENKAAAAEATIAIVEPAIIDVTVNVQPGVNLLSLPVAPTNPAVVDVFDGKALSVRQWRTTSTRRRILNLTDTIQPLRGYVAIFDAPGSLIVTGTEQNNRLSLLAGWNLVGPARAATAPVGAIPGLRIFGVQGDRLRYRSLTAQDELHPGKAYWMYVPTDTLLDLAPYELPDEP